MLFLIQDRRGDNQLDMRMKGDFEWYKTGVLNFLCCLLCGQFTRASRARMRLIVGFLQSFGGEVGVNLRGRQVGVSQQFLHAPQIRAGIQQMGGVAVS